jgi:WD40 repeat protein
MIVRIARTFALVSLAVVLEAQTQSSINGPVAGYVFDKASQALRPVMGLAGASLLGSPVSFGYRVTAAFVSPHLDSAFAVASDGTSHFFQIGSGTLQEVSISGLASAGPSYRLAFSPSGTALALYTANSLQVLTGLPGTPKVAGSVDLTSIGNPNALALSDDGTALMVSANSAIRLFGSFADMGTLINTAGTPAMAFAVGNHDAAVSDSAAGLLLFQDLLGTEAQQVVAPPAQNSAPSSALAFSSDEKSIYVATSSTQTITRFDLTANTSSSLPCSCSPTSLARMGNVFRLTDLGTDPLWLLDQPESNARVVFVPALAQAEPAKAAPKPLGLR